MESRERWARYIKRRLEESGFKVSLIDPELAVERKKASRMRDQNLLANGSSPRAIQRKNSVFGRQAKQFRILNYGGLKRAT
jgi:hypothetical protein